MVKKQKTHSEERWKQGRVSIRIHEDLRSALDFLADRDHRPLSNYVEMLLVQAVRERIANPLTPWGERDDDDRPWAPIEALAPPPPPDPSRSSFNPPKPVRRR